MCGVIKRRKRRAEQDAYTASFGQGVATISGKCPLAGLFQLMVARILYDGLKPCLHTDTQQRLASQPAVITQTTKTSNSVCGEQIQRCNYHRNYSPIITFERILKQSEESFTLTHQTSPLISLKYVNTLMNITKTY